jgi:cysteine desulfurase
MERPLVYLDNAATTCPDPHVLDVMNEVGKEYYGNASSLHNQGTRAHELIDQYRVKIAAFLNAKPEEIFFTGSGTESNNLALKGIAFAQASKGNHIVVSAIEHDCILKTAFWLETRGFKVTYIPVDHQGIVDTVALEKAIGKDTILVSVMHVNNEIGTIEPVKEIGKICRSRNIYFHSDACQSFGKIQVNVNDIGADLLTINAHKIHGPKGVAALYIRSGVDIEPLLHGGGQEKGIRSSTENLPGIAGFIKAAEIACAVMETEIDRVSSLQERIINSLQHHINGVYFNGSLSGRLPHNINFCIEGLEGEGIRLQLLLDETGICISTGSACSSNDGNNPSHVLQAIGLDPFQARGGIRVSLGRFNTLDEINYFLEVLQEKVKQLKPIF